MALRWYSCVVNAKDPRALAAWWAQALDWQLIYEDEDEAVIVPKWAFELTATLPFHQVPPGMVFVSVPEPTPGPNRLHVDLAPHTSDDRDAEIARLLELGATHADVGQGPDVTWTVLADPEGNEFCVLSSRDR